jgi:hypothetical protein
MKTLEKRDFPVSDARRFLEPGPVVLVSALWRNRANIMTTGWHMIMEMDPSLIGCYIWTENHQLRDGAQEQGMRDKSPDCQHGCNSGRNWQLLRPRHQQVRKVWTHWDCRQHS